MNKLLLLMALATPVRSDEIQCLAETIHAEAMGEPLVGAIAVGHNVKNRAARLNQSVCTTARSGYAQRRIPPNLHKAYRLIAAGIIRKDIPDITNGADSFNRGRKPQFKGDIKRVIGKHVHYRMKSL
jgi:hypothetical protein